MAKTIVRGAEERGILHREEHAEVYYIVAHGIATTLYDKRAIIGSRHFVCEDEGVSISIRKHALQANTDREALAKKIIRQKNLCINESKSEAERELLKLKNRCTEIENSYVSLYENLSKGIITDSRFKMMSRRYDKEQQEIEARISELEEQLKQHTSQTKDINSFIDGISGYAGITELNPKILNILIDRIEVSERTVIDGEETQKVRIFYNFVGDVNEEE